MASKPASNPGYTTLKSVGRNHRDEPFHLVYPLVLYPRKAKVDPVLLNDWCATRYLGSRKKTGTRWRIETYKHKDGKRYVHRLMLEALTDDEQMELIMRFDSEFGKNKVIRTGKLQRPRLTKAEKQVRDEWIERFYQDVSDRRRAAAAEQASLAL
jgi:hypothetical protein